MSMNDAQIEASARAAYEANRAYCMTLGDYSQVPWNEAPPWQCSSIINGVKGVIAGNGPEESHSGWLEEKRAAGWKYGPVKDADKKEHPCFLPYAELPPSQKAKDHIFIGVVRAFMTAFEVFGGAS
jgi:hypothetical protein